MAVKTKLANLVDPQGNGRIDLCETTKENQIHTNRKN